MRSNQLIDLIGRVCKSTAFQELTFFIWFDRVFLGMLIFFQPEDQLFDAIVNCHSVNFKLTKTDQ